LEKILLSTAYLPPINYFAYMLKSQTVIIENYENYTKQSYRNRCYIAGANGIQSLHIPVKKTAAKMQINEVKIDNDSNWQTNHWQSIISAYNNSPFFEYYQHDFEAFYKKKFTYLLEYNTLLTNKILELIQINIRLKPSDSFFPVHPDNSADLRYRIHPKLSDNSAFPSYYQVFDIKYGFLPNLSIIDLLFNIGNESGMYLQKLANNFKLES